MRLKSVEIHGFKSFPDKTKLEFNQQITAVVGPNGSGKSNIGDAIRWVLGEQSSKNLRGSKMEDVIFDGTLQRKQQGFASVALTIDNQERAMDINADEVVIARKIYRSGDSEYRINGAEVRLKDIHQLFMDTGLGKDGYSIIGQGKISEIISAKSKERREIFEEAAGIAKYRYHKIEAQKRLEQAEENLERLKDILSELEVRIEPLRRDSEKAANFILLADEKKKLEISLWMNTLERSKDAMREQEDSICLLQAEYDEVQQQLEQEEQEINTIFLQMQSYSVDMDNARQWIKQHEEAISHLHAREAVARNNQEHNNQALQDLEKEWNALGESKQGIELDLVQKEQQAEEKKEQYEALLLQKKQLEQEIQTCSVKVKTYTQAVEQCKAKRTAIYAQLNETRIRSATSGTVIEQSQKRLVEIAQESLKKEESLLQIQQDIEECRGFMIAIAEKMDQLQNADSGYLLKLESKEEKLELLLKEKQKVTDDIRQKRQRAKLLEDMERSFEGFSHSIKFLLQAAKSGAITGIRGTVSSVLHVEQKYSLALETALGAAMQNMIVENEVVAKQAIAYLNKNKSGRATFLPLTTIRGTSIDFATIQKRNLCIGMADTLTQYDSQYHGIIQNLLGRIVIVEDLDTATEVAKANGYRFRIVTLDGQVIHAGGSFTGGSQVQSAGILSRRSQIETLQTEAKTLEIKDRELQLEIDEQKREMAAIQAQRDAIQSERQTAKEDRMQAEAEQQRLQYTMKETKATIDLVANEKKQLETQLESLSKADSSIIERIQMLEEGLKGIEEEIAKNNLGVTEVGKETEQHNLENAQIDLQLVSLQKDRQMLLALYHTLKESADSHQQRRQALLEKKEKTLHNNSQLEEESKRCETETKHLQEEVEQLQKKIHILTQQRRDAEQKTTQLRLGTKEITLTKEKKSGELTRLRERKNSMQSEYDSIISKLWDEYELTRSQAQEFASVIEDVIEAEKRINTLKNSIRGLGNVNLGAIEEYQEVGERYGFLKKQVQDIEQSRTQLNRLITDLTMQMKDIFSRQFAMINSNFSRIFVELFGGGKAELILTDTEDVLESGIDIYVQPPGKVIKNLSSLSGGEQAFVAIAIYFAILHVNPSPFCILDEIEAALDDVNVTKYAQYLRKLSDRTQFIAISHRRGTMEEADVLYGVTMQEEGVSKLLTLQVTEIEERLGIASGTRSI